MRNILIIIICTVLFTGCKTGARRFGGEAEIVLDKNQKLLMATWKDNNLWYLTEEMDSAYTPKKKMLIESSNFGILEGKVIFIESK